MATSTTGVWCPVCHGTGLLITRERVVLCGACGGAVWRAPDGEGYISASIVPARDSLWWRGREQQMPTQWGGTWDIYGDADAKYAAYLLRSELGGEGDA